MSLYQIIILTEGKKSNTCYLGKNSNATEMYRMNSKVSYYLLCVCPTNLNCAFDGLKRSLKNDLILITKAES